MAKRKHHHRRNEKSIWSEFRFEIFIAFLFFLGVFLLVEQMEIKATIFYWISTAIRTSANAVYSVARLIRDTISQVETSDIVGIVLILTSLVLIALRFRKKVIHRYSTLYSCPECGGDLHRTHRNTSQKLLELVLYAKIKHYKCKQCSYGGIQITEK